MSDRPNAPEPATIAGVDCQVYSAGPYAAVDADVADERKGGRSAGVVAREMARWAGIREAENLKWMLNEMLADANRENFRGGRFKRALHVLLYSLPTPSPVSVRHRRR